MFRFAAAAGGLILAATAAAFVIAQRGVAPGRLHGARQQITTADALKKRLATARRSFKTMAAVDSRVAVDEVYRKLRERLDDLTYASQGFFPEAEAMNDAALQDLFAARDQAYVDVVADRERRIADLNREIRETNRRRPR